MQVSCPICEKNESQEELVEDSNPSPVRELMPRFAANVFTPRNAKLAQNMVGHHDRQFQPAPAMQNFRLPMK